MSGDAEAMKPLLAAVAGGRALAAEEAAAAFEIIMSGDATAAQIGAFLMALRCAAKPSRKSPRRLK